jgi:hypothetical protein
VPWKTVATAAALVLGAVTAQAMTPTPVHQQDGMIAKVVYGCEPGEAQFGTFCLVRPHYYDYVPPHPYYDYVPPDAYDAMDPTPVCHHSEEIVSVPAERGGTRQIRIIRCP